ncbi:hypothetical protein K7432_005360 [Basidiobolus ranarum]|uniref:t-SNARE coiled-coil homology domain-containing protein n=1 Tax=Basidiobolus ranarum TaxID=34480 RepID=A0ABR2WWL3_9FUNG
MTARNGLTPSQMEKGIATVMSGIEFNRALEKFNALRINIENNIDAIHEIHQDSLDILNAEESAANSTKLRELTAQTTFMLEQCKSNLKDLHRNVLESDDVELRRRRCASAKAQLENTLRRYRETEQIGQENYKNMLRRHYAMVNPEATDNEVEEYIQRDPSGQVFANAILRKNEANQTLQLVKDRHQDIIEITRMINELDSLFRQVHDMVEEQQETIQQVEEKIMITNDHLNDANGELEKSKELISSNRSTYRIMALVALLIVIALAVVIYFTLRKK